MRKEVTAYIKNGLGSYARPSLVRHIPDIFPHLVMTSKRAKCAMNYERYIPVVVLGYGCMIMRWPSAVSFCSPTHIYSVDEMRILRDAWRDGTCYWKALNAKEKEEWREKYNEQLESGEIVKKSRKRRADKDTTRGPNERTLKKRLAGEKSKRKSKAVIEDEERSSSSSSDGSSEEDEEDDEEEEEEPVRKTWGKRGGEKWWHTALEKVVQRERESEKSKKMALKEKSSREKKKSKTVAKSSGGKSSTEKGKAGSSGGRKRKERDEEEPELPVKKARGSGSRAGCKRKRVEDDEDVGTSSKRKNTGSTSKGTRPAPSSSTPASPKVTEARPVPKPCYRNAPTAATATTSASGKTVRPTVKGKGKGGGPPGIKPADLPPHD